jgi:hypothetical protein
MPKEVFLIQKYAVMDRRRREIKIVSFDKQKNFVIVVVLLCPTILNVHRRHFITELHSSGINTYVSTHHLFQIKQNGPKVLELITSALKATDDDQISM